jgi:hypothetical protein
MRWPRSPPAPGAIPSAARTYASGCRRSSAGTTPRAAPPTRSRRCATGHAPEAASRACAGRHRRPGAAVPRTPGLDRATARGQSARALAGSGLTVPSYPTVRRYLKAQGMFRQAAPSARARARCSRATGSSTARCAASSSIMSRRCGTWTSTTARAACSPARAPGRSPSCWASWTIARAWSATCSGTWTRARRAWSMVCPRPS